MADKIDQAELTNRIAAAASQLAAQIAAVLAQAGIVTEQRGNLADLVAEISAAYGDAGDFAHEKEYNLLATVIRGG